MTSTTRSAWAWLAALILAAATLVGVAPTTLAQATPTVTLSEVPTTGGEVTITGKDFATKGPGVYVAVAPSTVPEFYGHSSEFVGAEPGADMTESKSTVWVFSPEFAGAGSMANTKKMEADGSFVVTLNVPPKKDGVDYVVLTTKAHGQGKTDKSQDTRTPVVYATSDPATPPAPNGCPEKKVEDIGHGYLSQTGLLWGIDKLFYPYAEENKYTIHAVKATPVGGATMFDRELSLTVKDNKILLAWPGYLEFRDADGNGVAKLGQPRMVIESQEKAELYLTIIDGDADPQEVHVGTASGPFFMGEGPDGFEMIRTENSPVALDPEAIGALPGLRGQDGLPPLTMSIFLRDEHQFGDKLAQVYFSIIDQDKGCPTLPWLVRWAKSPAYKEPPAADDAKPAERITVEEENKLFNQAPVAEAEPGNFKWGVLNSWQGYAGGGERSDNVGFSKPDRSYVFTDGKVIKDTADEKIVQFKGRIHWDKYGKLLWITFADPQVRIAKDGSAQVWVKKYSLANAATNEEKEDGWTKILDMPKGVTDDGTTIKAVSAETYMSKDYAEVFINAYREGKRMSDISFTVVRDTPVSPAPSTSNPPVPAPSTSNTPTPAPAPGATTTTTATTTVSATTTVVTTETETIKPDPAPTVTVTPVPEPGGSSKGSSGGHGQASSSVTGLVGIGALLAVVAALLSQAPALAAQFGIPLPPIPGIMPKQ